MIRNVINFTFYRFVFCVLSPNEMTETEMSDLLKGVVSVGSGGGKFSVKLTLHKSVLQQQKRYVPF